MIRWGFILPSEYVPHLIHRLPNLIKSTTQKHLAVSLFGTTYFSFPLERMLPWVIFCLNYDTQVNPFLWSHILRTRNQHEESSGPGWMTSRRQRNDWLLPSLKNQNAKCYLCEASRAWKRLAPNSLSKYVFLSLLSARDVPKVLAKFVCMEEEGHWLYWFVGPAVSCQSVVTKESSLSMTWQGSFSWLLLKNYHHAFLSYLITR